jgi:rRNA-processing protein Efg1
VKQIQKSLSTASELSSKEKKKLQKQLHEAEVDLNYTIYAPKDEPYVSIYAGKNKDAEAETSSAPVEKPEVWKEIEAKMNAGTLKVGKAFGPGKAEPEFEPSVRQKGVQRTTESKGTKESQKKTDKDKKGHKKSELADDDGSDGGFFDE